MSSRKALILIVDDEAEILSIVRRTLELEGYRVVSAGDAESAMAYFKAESEMPDLAILDIMLPGIDGHTLCRRIHVLSETPVIMLTARDEENDKLTGFECGADDYVTKPFSRKELLARVKAVLRRSKAVPVLKQSVTRIDDIEIDFTQSRVTRDGCQPAPLTPTENQLLRELVVNRGKVLTNTYLLQKVWGNEYQDEKEYLHVFYRTSQGQDQEDPRRPEYINTLFGVGYEFKE